MFAVSSDDPWKKQRHNENCSSVVSSCQYSYFWDKIRFEVWCLARLHKHARLEVSFRLEIVFAKCYVGYKVWQGLSLNFSKSNKEQEKQ